MIIKELKLVNHRNYEYENIIFHENTNILVGKNAQGKTNLLESIYICARGYSFKNIKDDQLIRFGEKESYLRAFIINNDRKKIVEVKFSENDKKRIRINEVEVLNLSELKSQFGVVIFSPEELKIVKETPSLRRKFIDDIISNNDIVYKNHLIKYNKIRSQKNDLIKNSRQNKYFEQMLTALNSKICEHGSVVAIYRSKYLTILKKFAKEYHKILTNEKEELDIHYINNFSDKLDNLKEIENNFSKRLEENKNREIEQYSSLYGPHKDDFLFLINGLDVRMYGSQGQQRTVMLSLKLAEAKLIETVTKLKPILLLDDVFSELDHQRAKLLVESIKGYQTIITTNSLINIDTKKMFGNIYSIISGKVISQIERKNNG